MQNSELKFGLKTFESIEKDVIRERLFYFDGNRTHTAKSLNIGLRTLQRKIHKFDLSVPYSPAARRGRFGEVKPVPMKDGIAQQTVVDLSEL